MNQTLSRTIAAILGGASVGLTAAAIAAPADTEGEALGEIVVTAQRRSESMQNVPISMQAFTGRTIADLHVATFDDYIKYLPNVTSANNGPGQNEIFMRGLSAGAQPSQGSGTTAAFPNVAIYLDNQSGQLPGRNLDVYAADIERIEVLEGPQGTLFGSGAEAGMIRYITNQPKINITEGSVKAGYGTTAHGDANSDLTAMLNLPLIADKLAVRGVIYSDHRGGYIDNVPATFTRRNTDVGIHYANYPADAGGNCPDGRPNAGWCVPPNAISVNNNAIAATAINPVTYKGFRVQGLFKFNDDWDFLLSQSWQNMQADGVFYQQPNGSNGEALRPLEVTLFNSSYNKDKFSNTAWTLNGKFGPLRAVYTGGYLTRRVEQIGDYTNYARGFYADYYQCYGASAFHPSTCFSPQVIWRAKEQNQHWQHEFRLSTPDDWRARGIAGVYLEKNKLYDQSDWRYKTVPPCTTNGPAGVDPGNSDCFTPIGQYPGTTIQEPGVRDINSSFFQDDVREVKQTAFFVSFDFDIVPKVLTFTAGTRHFKFKNSLKGNVAISFYCFQQGAPALGCLDGQNGYDLDGANLQDTESGWKSRVNLSWHVTPDIMLYYTFSQGFRPGGFNQNGGALHAYGPDGIPQYAVPKSYQSDKLDNQEIGWKAEFLDHRLQWNGAIYHEKWDNVQVAFFNPGLVGNVFYNTNGQNFDLKGIETSLIAKVVPGLTLQAAASWNRSKQTNSPTLIANNDGSYGQPKSGNYGNPITKNCDATGANCVDVTNPFGPIGSPTANSPPMQFSLRARYDWTAGDYNAYVQVGAMHVAHSFTQAGSNPALAADGIITTGRLRFENEAYSTYDAAIGLSKDSWSASVVGENLSNSNAALFTSTQQFIVAQTPLRPRVISLNLSYKF
ncbi:MAG: TonB-dependent receptor [Steroidobacteraceae bacterium]